MTKCEELNSPALCKGELEGVVRIYKTHFQLFRHPELAKDLPPQREILAGDASLPLSMTVRLFITTEWFPETTKATKGQKMENLTALPLHGGRGRTQALPKTKTIPAPPLFIEEVARSAGGVYITISKNSLPASGNTKRFLPLCKGELEGVVKVIALCSWNLQSKI